MMVFSVKNFKLQGFTMSYLQTDEFKLQTKRAVLNTIIHISEKADIVYVDKLSARN